MNVIKINPRGYCRGVVNALEIVKKAIKDYPNHPIYIVGMLIHNKFVKEALRLKGVISFDDKIDKMTIINKIESGVVIFTAHGTAQSVKNAAIRKGLIVIDATCQDVIKTQNMIKQYLDNDYDILYIGKKGHPEAEAAISLNKQRIYLINSFQDIDDLTLNNSKIFVTNQTTMSLYDVKQLFDNIKVKFPHAVLTNEVCAATRVRQEALFDAEKYDLVYVVGDVISNNANNLKKITSPKCRCLLIESAQDIKQEDLIGVNDVAVTAAASTPHYLTQQVINYLMTGDHQYQKIDYSKIL